MRRITTITLVAAFALIIGAIASTASEEPGQLRPAVSETHSEAGRQSQDERASGLPTDQEYVVQEGDTLAGIAEQELGAAEKWRLIADANGIDDPRSLHVGQRLKIPARDS